MVLKNTDGRVLYSFVYEAVTLYGGPFQVPSTRARFCNSSATNTMPPVRVLQHPQGIRSCPVNFHAGLGFSPFARRYQGNNLFSSGYLDVSVPPVPIRHKRMPGLFIQAGSPIRRSPAKLARQLTEAYLSLTTSFIGLQRLGIHRAPFVALTTTPLSTQHVVSFISGTGLIPQVINSIRLLTFAPAIRRTFRPQELLAAEGSVDCPFGGSLVEPGGLEPPTSALQRRRSPN